MLDPTTTHRLTTAAVPEWAAEVTGDARDAEIARLQREKSDLWEDYCDANVELGTRAAKIAYFEQELADVKAECCQLVDRNGDLEAENARLKAEALNVVNNGASNSGRVTVSVPTYWFDRLVEAVHGSPAKTEAKEAP